MIALVLGDLALLPDGTIWVLGCDCVRPRRCLMKYDIQTKKLKAEIVKNGTNMEIRRRV